MRFAGRIIEYIRGKGIGAESIRYIVVGVLTTLINIGLLALMQKTLGIDSTVSNVVSDSVAILFAYVTNKLFVFRWHSSSMGELALEFFKFVGSRLLTMAVDVGFYYLFHDVLGYNWLLIKVMAMVLVIILNYILSKAIVFRSGGKGSVG